MKIKAIFFDIDGTLVSIKTHAILSSAKQAVQAVRRKGVKVFIATGRPGLFIDNLEDLEYDGIIETNGAHCELTDGTVISHHPIPQADVKRMNEYQLAHDLPVVYAAHDELFITSHTPTSDMIFRMLNLDPPQLGRMEHALQMDILQIIAFFDTQEEPFLMEHVLPGCVAQRWHPTFADVIAKGCDKSTGIDETIRHLGISLEDTMAFGDGGNDVGMLGHVGLGVAMGNASDYVKQYADYVTADVDEDGVARALERFVL